MVTPPKCMKTAAMPSPQSSARWFRNACFIALGSTVPKGHGASRLEDALWHQPPESWRLIEACFHGRIGLFLNNRRHEQRMSGE